GWPPAQLEMARARGALPPHGRHLGDATTGTVRLDGELERQLESGLALDLHAVEKGAPIETEVARRIVDRQTGEVMQRKTGKTREHHLEGRAADLSASRHVAARRSDIRARARERDHAVDRDRKSG